MTIFSSAACAIDAVLNDFLALKQQSSSLSLHVVGKVVDDWLLAKAEEETWNSRFGNLFNPLTLVPLKETIHSRIIGELLNPNGSHGQGSLFVRCLLDRMGVPNAMSGEWQLVVEADRVDLMLARERPRSVILIENKANDAVDQPNQLYRYWHRQIYRRFPWLDYTDMQMRRSFRVIYLSNDGKKMPAPHSLDRPEGWEGINPEPVLPLPCEPLGLGELLGLLNEAAVKRAPDTNTRLRTFLKMYSEIWKS